MEGVHLCSEAVEDSYTISQYRSTQRCAAIFPVGGMKHSQDDPRRPLRPPSGGRDDLIGEVMRKKRHRPDPSGSKYIGWICTANWY